MGSLPSMESHVSASDHTTFLEEARQPSRRKSSNTRASRTVAPEAHNSANHEAHEKSVSFARCDLTVAQRSPWLKLWDRLLTNRSDDANASTFEEVA